MADVLRKTSACGYGSRIALAPDSARALPGARLSGTTGFYTFTSRAKNPVRSSVT
jgi:hypothetical protein